MTHNDPVLGNPITIEWATGLDLQGEYQPELTASVTGSVSLGDDGQAVGVWWLRGHLCTGSFRFEYAGAGINRGDGFYRITLPFAVDGSIMEIDESSLGNPFIVGGGRCAASPTRTNSRLVITYLGSTMHLIMLENAAGFSAGGAIRGADAEWRRIYGDFRYLVDPSELESL